MQVSEGAAPRGQAQSAREGQPPLRHVVVAIVALSMGGFAIGVTEFSIMGLLQEAVADLGVSIPQGGHLVSAYALGVVVGGPGLAIVAAKRERRSFVLVLLGLFAVGHALSFFAPNYETMLASRFISGLPHGAFFGVAALMAAQMAGPMRRAKAISGVLAGLAVANVIGVPIVTSIGQQFGWRWMFAVVLVLAIATMIAVRLFAPRQEPVVGASMVTELKGLRSKRLWVAVAMAVVGFSGMFALYSYISPVMTDVAGLAPHLLPLVVGLYGVGMVIGNFLGGWATDKSVMATILIALALSAVFLFAFSATAGSVVLALLFMFLVAVSSSMLSPSVQTHLIDSVPDAPNTGATIHHSAFNAANALGAVLGAQVLTWGYGLRAPSFVGAIGAALGVMIALYAWKLKREEGRPAPASR